MHTLGYDQIPTASLIRQLFEWDDLMAFLGDVLAGDGRERVVVEPMTPGTLMLFEGRRSLHRVTPVVGERARYVALLGYDTKPGTMSSDLLRQVRYGRTEPLRAAG